MTGIDRLGAADSWFLYLEGPNQHLHVTGLMLLDPATSPDAVTFEKFFSHVEARLDHLPSFRKRLVEVPLGIDHPALVEDPDLDLRRHITHESFRGRSDSEFRTFLDEFASGPIERDKPLWEMVFATDLPDGSCALVAKLHHTLIDGVTGVGILADLLDLEPDASADKGTPADPPPSAPTGVPTATESMLDAVASRLADPMRPVRAARRAGSSLLRAADAVVTARGAGREQAAPFGMPRTRINASLTERRAVSFGTTALQPVKDLKAALGVTVNDVVLSAVSAGLRGFLAEHDTVPEVPLVASVPVSVHGPVADAARTGPSSTNQVSNMFVHLPVQIEDPMQRLRAVQRSASGAKEIQGAIGPEMLGDMVDLVPPAFLSLGMAAYSRAGLADRTPAAHTLIVSNVPGPDFPLYLAGAQVTGLYPFGPLMEGSGLNVTLLSHDGRLDVGLIACPELVPDLDDLLAGIISGFDELLALGPTAGVATGD